MTETLTRAYVYSFESSQRELFNEYQHDRVQMVFKNLWALLLLIEIALEWEGLMVSEPQHRSTSGNKSIQLNKSLSIVIACLETHNKERFIFRFTLDRDWNLLID